MLFYAKKVEARIDEILSVESVAPQLVEAMRYSSLGAGKKIRPFLLLKFVEVLGFDPDSCLDFAAALEMIHAYSLIHDDLPAMDDDDFRRGRPSCHKRFNEATAILAGDALLTLAFEVASRPQKNSINQTKQLEIIGILAKNSGKEGMVGGQMLDLEAMRKIQNLSLQEILKIHHLKTGKMFIAAVEIGAILGNAKREEGLEAIEFASNFGIIFQLQDDLDDFENDKRQDNDSLENSKTAKTKDFNNQQTMNLAAIFGQEECLKMLKNFKKKAVKNLQIFGKKAENLQDLVGD